MQCGLGKSLAEICFGAVYAGNKELLLFVFCAYDGKDGIGSAVSKEDFSLSVDNMFLQVKRNGLRYAEVFHCLRDGYPKLLAQFEEGVNCCSCSKDNCRVVRILIFCALNSLAVRGSTLKKGLKSIFILCLAIISVYGELLVGAGCEINILLIFILLKLL